MSANTKILDHLYYTSAESAQIMTSAKNASLNMDMNMKCKKLGQKKMKMVSCIEI